MILLRCLCASEVNGGTLQISDLTSGIVNLGPFDGNSHPLTEAWSEGGLR
jgi:hypothetical protein